MRERTIRQLHVSRGPAQLGIFLPHELHQLPMLFGTDRPDKRRLALQQLLPPDYLAQRTGHQCCNLDRWGWGRRVANRRYHHHRDGEV